MNTPDSDPSPLTEDLTARWSQTLEEMYRAERRIVELESQLAALETLLREVQPTVTVVPGKSTPELDWFEAYIPEDWATRRDTLPS